MVRAAVLKGKDPLQLISDMEKIDEMGELTTHKIEILLPIH